MKQKWSIINTSEIIVASSSFYTGLRNRIQLVHHYSYLGLIVRCETEECHDKEEQEQVRLSSQLTQIPTKKSVA